MTNDVAAVVQPVRQIMWLSAEERSKDGDVCCEVYDRNGSYVYIYVCIYIRMACTCCTVYVYTCAFFDLGTGVRIERV